MKFLVNIEQGPENFSAYVPDLPGCVSTSETREETLKNNREAIKGHLEVMREYGNPILEPTTEATEVEVKNE